MVRQRSLRRWAWHRLHLQAVSVNLGKHLALGKTKQMQMQQGA
jgi:hypothetical protein